MDATLETRALERVLDVKVKLTVKLGSCQLPMKEILDMTPGAVIQLDQQARDPVGLYVNDKLIAHGEVVVVEDAFGIKITDIVGNAS
ncbi:MAG: flagellar motor switch protein FliN [Verrucomicrobia bacterium]|nr:MAG: flagellar motor switch protein FliN [Verrucomicrobiota bacterium]